MTPKLKDLQFSDIILHSDGSATLKGMPGFDQRMVAVSPEHDDEVRALLELVTKQFEGKANDARLRIQHGGIIYRAVTLDDVNQKVFFLRRLAEVVPEFQKLGLTPVLVELMLSESHFNKGLLLIAGAQGAGKTTTAASFIQERLSLYGGHAVSFENPVEMPLSGSHGDFGRCYQTEVNSEEELGKHIKGSHCLCSPNIIYIGEIGSKYAASESLRVALGSNLQLVVATIHGFSVVAALERLLDLAKEIDSDIARRNLSQTLVGIIQVGLVNKPGSQDRIISALEFLLVPFLDSTLSIRSNLAEANFKPFEGYINTQRNRAADKRDLFE
jgi:twitching motility protein PilT